MDFGEHAGEWELLFSNYKIKVINAEDAEVAKNCRTELKQFLEVMGARRDQDKMDRLLQDKAYENLSYETARMIAVVANVPDFWENEEKYKNQEEGGYNMCQAIEELKVKYENKGKAEALRNLMETMHLNLEQAMNALKIPEENRPRLRQLL